MWELDYKKAECWRIDAFELWCWRVFWTSRRSSQSILKEISPEYSLEGLMLKLKLKYFGHVIQIANSLEKTLMLGKIEGRRKKGDDRGQDGWIASPTQWTWVWASSGRWQKSGKSGKSGIQQRVGHDWATEQQGRGETGQIVRGVLSDWCREDSKTSSSVGASLVFNREDQDIAIDSEVSGECEESSSLESLFQMPLSKSCLSFPHQRPYLSATDYYCWTLNFFEIQPLRP